MQANDGDNSYETASMSVSLQLSNSQDGAEDILRQDQTQSEEKTCVDTQASSSIGSSWQVSLNSEERQTNDHSGCPDTYENMMSRMGEIEKTLTTIQEKVTKSSVRCHLLNIDVVTMFSPEMVDQLNNTVEQCEKCLKAMETLSSTES
ncbi:uncharacterized protein [Montipora capricornis]|uniref:uncharacterized protein n=1 Tax=Montipora capricornis TaxID=246305 RepID=UPI0035F132FB